MASYICEDCGKSFATNYKFNFHRKYHVKSDKEEECKFCRKNFNNTIKLSQHQSKCERFWCEYSLLSQGELAITAGAKTLISVPLFSGGEVCDKTPHFF